MIKIIDNDENVLFEVSILNADYNQQEKMHISFFESRWNDIREQRDRLFKQSEWIYQRHTNQIAQGLPTTITLSKFDEWLSYWQALRDITTNFTNPFDAVLPEMPSDIDATGYEEIKQTNQRIFGERLSKESVDKIGIRILELEKSGVATNSQALLQTLGVIQNLTSSGALKKARDLAMYYRPSFLQYSDTFDYLINSITAYFNRMGY